MGPLNPGCFDCFPLACPVLASFSTSFSTYAFPFQILCLNGTRFLPNWHKFLWLIAATYMQFWINGFMFVLPRTCNLLFALIS